MTVKNGSNTEKTLSLQEHHDLGVEKLARYNYPDALRHFIKTVYEGKYILDLHRLAECMERLKMFDRFIEMFSEDRLEKIPIPYMWGNLGDIYYYKHDEEKAMECYGKELKNMEKDFADKIEQLEYNTSYAKTLAKNGEYKRAFEIMDRAIRKDPEDYNNWYTAGWIAHKAKVYGQALKLLDIAIDHNPECVVTMVELSEVHEKLGNMFLAKDYILQAYRIDSYWWKTRDRNNILNFELY